MLRPVILRDESQRQYRDFAQRYIVKVDEINVATAISCYYCLNICFALILFWKNIYVNNNLSFRTLSSLSRELKISIRKNRKDRIASSKA